MAGPACESAPQGAGDRFLVTSGAQGVRVVVPASQSRETKISTTTGRRGWLLAAFSLVIALFAFVSAGQAMAGVIEKPRSGQRIASHPVRIVVEAGPERGDLKATLNGREVGEQFVRKSTRLRVLDATLAHGLRFGVNVLRVRSRFGLETRRESVRFRVAHRRSLVSAGRDLRVGEGTRFRLGGRVAHHPRGSKARRFTWKLVKAPGASQLRKGTRGKGSGFGNGKRLKTTFRPDVKGRYVLELIGRSVKPVRRGQSKKGTRALRKQRPVVSRDRVTVDAVPQGTLIPVSTETGGDSFGIKVGNDVFRAPPLHVSPTGTPGFRGSSNLWTFYESLWQVLVLDRSTLAPTGFNVTYGFCKGPRGTGICQKGDDGEPFLVRDPAGKAADGSPEALAGRIGSFGPTRIVLAANHYDGNQHWGLLDTWNIATRGLKAAGFPADLSGVKGADLSAMSAALIGVPGMAPGAADYEIVAGSQKLTGYLSPDPHFHFGFMPDRRETFDTRLEPSCDEAKCTIEQTVAGKTYSGSLPAGSAGYLVTAVESHDLTEGDSQVFATSSPSLDTNLQAEEMGRFIIDKARTENVVFAISSLTTPGAPRTAGTNVSREYWERLTNAIRRAGGTANRFNRSASTPASDYTLIGWDDAGEGNGTEETGPGARLRGALVPGKGMEFRPAVASGGAAPPERLAELVIEPQSNEWTPLGSGAAKAFAAIGMKTGITSAPRSAYSKLTSFDDATRKHDAVEDLTYREVAGDSPAFSESDFKTARSQLLLELSQVANVRLYLAKLAAPADAVQHSAWEDASILQNRLAKELEIYDEDAELSFDIFDSLVSLLGFAAQGFEWKEFEAAEKLTLALINATIGADVLFTADYDGTSPIDEDARIQADQLAQALEQSAAQSSLGFQRMGDVIVTDPVKLAEVGTYANCVSPCGTIEVDGEEIDLDQYSTDEMETAAAISARSLERTIYTKLVPLSFPVWNTGETAIVDPSRFSCFWQTYNAFDGAPDKTWTSSLTRLDPTGVRSFSEVYVMVHRKYLTFSWPDEAILDRMFDPVPITGSPTEGGLGIDPVDLMRDTPEKFVPTGETCGWLNADE